MVEWCTQNLRRNGSISRGTSHATSTERYQNTTLVDINNTRYKRIQSFIQNHMRHVRSESAREQTKAMNRHHDIIIIIIIYNHRHYLQQRSLQKKKEKKKKKKEKKKRTNSRYVPQTNVQGSRS